MNFKKLFGTENAFDVLYRKYQGFTMVPYKTFADNLKIAGLAPEKGLVVECGVWRGGMMASIAEQLGNNYEYHLFDSFEGLPEAKELDGPDAIKWQSSPNEDDFFENCKAEKDYAMTAMKKSGVQKFTLHEGWFEQTIPVFAASKPEIAVLRLDGDWYESTLICLQLLFNKVVDNGIIIIDDYYTWDGCTKATHEYLSAFEPVNRIRSTENGVAYIIKNEKNEYRKYKDR